MSLRIGSFLSVLALGLGVSAFPASITQSATCVSGWRGQPLSEVDSVTSSCYDAADGRASSASATVSVSTNANVLTIAAVGQASAPDAGVSASFAPSESLATATYTVAFTLTTAGTGPGYIEVSEIINTEAAGEGYASVTVNGIPGLPACGGQFGCLIAPTFYAVDLGAPLSISITANTYADNSDDEGLSALTASIQASFFRPRSSDPYQHCGSARTNLSCTPFGRYSLVSAW